MPFRTLMQSLLCVLLALGLALATALPSGAGASSTLDREARQTLDRLYQENVVARQLRPRAKGELVFPKITKAGVGIGGSYGEGVLFVSDRPVEYYSVGSGSLGVTLGAAEYA